MKYFTRLILQVVILSTFIACKKDKTATAKYQLSFSHRALEYVQLTEGKYLIYKDSATSQSDSVVVTKSKLETLFEPGQNGDLNPPYNYEKFSLVLTKYNTTTATEWFNGNARLVLYPLPYVSSDTGAVSLYEQDGTPAFFFSESSQSNLTMTVEGKIYNNVVVTENNSGVDINHPAYKVTAYYWAKGAGIIKRRIITTGGVIKTYTLLRNN